MIKELIGVEMMGTSRQMMWGGRHAVGKRVMNGEVGMLCGDWRG